MEHDEVEKDVIKQMVGQLVEDVYSRGYDAGYSDGKKDFSTFDVSTAKAEAAQEAWNCARTIWNMIFPVRDKIFNTENLGDIFDSYSPSEAITKIKEYEAKNAEDEDMYRDFEVGDVVEHSASGNTFRAVVTCVSRNALGTEEISLMHSDGSISKQRVGYTPWRKTGKRVGVCLKAALEQIDQ